MGRVAAGLARAVIDGLKVTCSSASPCFQNRAARTRPSLAFVSASCRQCTASSTIASPATAMERKHTDGEITTFPSVGSGGGDVGDALPQVYSQGERHWKTATSEGSRGSEASLQQVLGISDAEAARLRNDGRPSAEGVKSEIVSAPCWERLVTPGGGRESLAWFMVDRLGADPRKVGSLALKNPVTVLGISSTAASKVLHFLQESVGMTRNDVAQALFRYPNLGHRRVENLKPKVQWLRENLFPQSSGLIAMIRASPQILSRSIEDYLEPQLLWMTTRLKLTPMKAAKLARTNPTLFFCSAQENFEPTIEWMKERMGLDDDDVVAMIGIAPSILPRNPQTGLEPKLDWLRDRAGLDADEIGALVRKCPSILLASVSNNLDPKLKWVREDLGLDAASTKGLLMRYPSFILASLEGNLKKKLPWLTHTIGFSREDAAHLLSRSPGLLRFSVDSNLEPTRVFYRDEMGASAEELRCAIYQNPRVLAVGLATRLRPRVSALREAGMKADFFKHYLQVCFSPDEKFARFVSCYPSDHGDIKRGRGSKKHKFTPRAEYLREVLRVDF